MGGLFSTIWQGIFSFHNYKINNTWLLERWIDFLFKLCSCMSFNELEMNCSSGGTGSVFCDGVTWHAWCDMRVTYQELPIPIFPAHFWVHFSSHFSEKWNKKWDQKLVQKWELWLKIEMENGMKIGQKSLLWVSLILIPIKLCPPIIIHCKIE